MVSFIHVSDGGEINSFKKPIFVLRLLLRGKKSSCTPMTVEAKLFYFFLLLEKKSQRFELAFLSGELAFL